MALCVLVASAVLSSCGGPSASDTAEKAINYLITEDFDSFYNLLSQKDQESISLENFKSLYQAPNEIRQLAPMVPDIHAKAYKAKDFKENITGEEAVVTYVLTLPDIDQLGRGAFSLQDIIDLSQVGKLKSLNDLPEEVKGKILEYIDKNGVPTKESVKRLNLVRENDEWRVDLDIPTMLESRKEIYIFD